MYALIDCNNFYASCEMVFNPSLDKKPLLILSNNDGCVIARSQKAKALGVKVGDPAFHFKGRSDVTMLSSNFALYADMSQRVMQILANYSPEMEIYSIDEAFLQFDQFDKTKAFELRHTVKKWTGIPISIGIAPTKTLAKVANKVAKKREDLGGVYTLLDPREIQAELEKTALEDLWGIGEGLSTKLKKKGIYTAAQFKECDDQWLKKLLGIGGYRTALELRGIPCFELLDEPEKKQSILCSRSWPDKKENLEEILEAIASYVSRAAEKLRDQQSQTSFLSVFLSTSPFHEPFESRSCHIQLPNATDYTPDLIAKAKEGLAKIYRKGFGYKKGGILLADFSDKETVQLDALTPDPKREKKTKAMEVLDQINDKYHKQALHFAAEGISPKLRNQSVSASPKYTTSWHEILKIKI